jgi:transcriptional regulator of arginine metabolism
MHEYAHPMPTTLDHRHARQTELIALLRDRRIARQDELVSALAERGHFATQSSVSRDLRELGVVKVRGRYIAPGPSAVAASPAEVAPVVDAGSTSEAPTELLLDTLHYVRDTRTAGPNLTLVMTAIGAAQTVAIALDRCGWPEIVGTLAGDDTIFVATQGVRDQSVFLKHFDRLRVQAKDTLR